MLITKKSFFTGKTHTMDLNVTQSQLDEHANGHDKIQNIFPHLTRDEREFLISGVTKEEWENVFGKEQ